MNLTHKYTEHVFVDAHSGKKWTVLFTGDQKSLMAQVMDDKKIVITFNCAGQQSSRSVAKELVYKVIKG